MCVVEFEYLINLQHYRLHTKSKFITLASKNGLSGREWRDMDLVENLGHNG